MISDEYGFVQIFFISAGEPYILPCAEKLIWTSQIEENESSCFCFPVVPIDGNLYRRLSHMALRNATNACSLPFQDEETLVTDFFRPEDEGI